MTRAAGLALLLATGFPSVPAAAALAAAVHTYESSPEAVVPEALPPRPGEPQSVSDTLVVADRGTIRDLDVTVTVRHPGHGDLAIDLTAPGGAVTARLIENEGGPGDGFANVTFDDEATELPPGFTVDGTCLTDRRYRPAPGSLAVFDGLEVQGTWTLTITDSFVGDAPDCDCDASTIGPECPRSLVAWSLTVDVDAGDEEEAPRLGCIEVLVLIAVILVLLAILWLLVSKTRP